MKKYLVTLTADEREHLTALIAAGKAAARKIAHARILLKADQADGGPAWADEEIAGALEVSTDTAEQVRAAVRRARLEAALVRKKHDGPSRGRVLDGAAEARLIAVACSEPPDERKAWTLRAGGRRGPLHRGGPPGDEKDSVEPHLRGQRCLPTGGPPGQSVARVEDGLGVYHRP